MTLSDGKARNARLASGVVVLGRYQLDERIAAGGMGVLWRATDIVLGETVALKRVSFVCLPEERAERIRNRTLREARLAARLRGHPYVVSLYDVLVDEGDVWLVLEYLPSVSLSHFIGGSDPLQHTEIARIGAGVSEALLAAHGLGIQHRDVTPSNILIGSDGRVKLTDFGIARSADEPCLTQTGAIIGTIPYLAPEVARDGESSSASDMFSLGATLYAALEGQPPFGRAENSMKMLRIVSAGVIRPPENAGSLEPLLLGLLDPNPDNRPDAVTAGAILRRLRDGDGEHESSHESLRRSAGRPFVVPTTPPDVPEPVDPVDSRRACVPAPGRVLLRLSSITMLAAILVVVGIPPSSGPGSSNAKIGIPSSTVPRLPDRVPPVWMPADIERVDTCPLMQNPVLRQFGQVNVVRGESMNSCGALVTNKDGGTTLISYESTVPTQGAVDDPDAIERHNLGGLRVAQQSLGRGDTPVCRGEVFLKDNSGFYGQVHATNSKGREVDLCAMMRALNVATAIDLARHGVPQSNWTRNYPLAQLSACELTKTGPLSSIRELRYREYYPKFANWGCVWGAGVGNTTRPTVSVDFALSSPGDFQNIDMQRLIRIGGKSGYQNLATTDEPYACSITIRPSQWGPNGNGTYQVVIIKVTYPEPRAVRCGFAKTIATTVEQSLS